MKSGIHLLVEPSSKYKTNALSLKFIMPYDSKEAIQLTLLARMFEAGSKAIGNRSQLEQALADLYGASLSVGGRRRADYYEFTLNSQMLADQFLPEDGLMHRWLDLLADLVLNQAFDASDEVMQARFALEKEQLARQLKRRQDNKKQLAARKLKEHLYQGSPEAYLGAYGDEALLDSLTLEDLQRVYDKLLQKAQIVCVAHGRLSEAQLETWLNSLAFRACPVVYSYQDLRLAIKPQAIAFQDEVIEANQGNLAMALATNYGVDDRERLKANVANAIFGQLPSSVLFMNIRERDSLAYSIHSTLDVYRELMIVQAGIDSTKGKEVYEKVFDELHKVAQTPINPAYFQEVKLTILSNRVQAQDYQWFELELVFLDWMNPASDYSLATYEANLQALTEAEVRQVLLDLTLLGAYFLKGGEA